MVFRVDIGASQDKDVHNFKIAIASGINQRCPTMFAPPWIRAVRISGLLKEGSSIKHAVLLMTCGDSSSATADPTIAMFRQICAYLKWKVLGTVSMVLHEQVLMLKIARSLILYFAIWRLFPMFFPNAMRHGYIRKYCVKRALAR